MEKVLIPKLLYHFYQTGQLLPPSAIQPTPTDSEYLCAVFSFAAELSRYTINRACQVSLSYCCYRDRMILMFSDSLTFHPFN